MAFNLPKITDDHMRVRLARFLDRMDDQIRKMAADGPQGRGAKDHHKAILRSARENRRAMKAHLAEYDKAKKPRRASRAKEEEKA